MIGFLNPLLLLGLALAGLPPLLHLLGRREPPTVPFPAVRYLSAAEREHSRTLKLRNLVLMLLRMLIIALLVLAAARPVVAFGGGSSHPPAAMALVVDNSLSSGAVVEGRTVAEALRERARAVAERATSDDRLWLVSADGVPRALSRSDLMRRLDTLAVQSVRLDLGSAVRSAAAAVEQAGLDVREVVVFSDLQASAVTAGEPVRVPVLVGEPPAPPLNAGVDAVSVEPSLWTFGGTVVAAVGGTRTEPVALQLMLDATEAGRAVGTVGTRVALDAVPPRTGWLSGTVRLDPDELRADDERWFAVRADRPVAVRSDPTLGPFVSEALAVLVEAGQLRAGTDVTFSDRTVDGVGVVFPPADPSLVGAVNRALGAAGASWRFGERLDGEWVVDREARAVEGVTVYRRHRLAGSGTTLARVGGEPWLVRDGSVTIVASRLEPTWTPLPTSAAFLPFLRYLATEVAVRGTGVVETVVGEPFTVPAGAFRLAMPAGLMPVSEGAVMPAPARQGVYPVLGAQDDTVGAVVVNHDPRESALTVASPAQVRAAWGATARILSDRELAAALFAGAARADMSSVLLMLALAAAFVELVLSGLGARVGRP